MFLFNLWCVNVNSHVFINFFKICRIKYHFFLFFWLGLLLLFLVRSLRFFLWIMVHRLLFIFNILQRRRMRIISIFFDMLPQFVIFLSLRFVFVSGSFLWPFDSSLWRNIDRLIIHSWWFIIRFNFLFFDFFKSWFNSHFLFFMTMNLLFFFHFWRFIKHILINKFVFFVDVLQRKHRMFGWIFHMLVHFSNSLYWLYYILFMTLCSIDYCHWRIRFPVEVRISDDIFAF